MAGSAPRRALVLRPKAGGEREERLGRILSFFGVPWQDCTIEDLAAALVPPAQRPEVAVFGPVELVADALRMPEAAATLRAAAAVYAYGSEDRSMSQAAVDRLFEPAAWRLDAPRAAPVVVEFSGTRPDIMGPMSGLRVSARLSAHDVVMVPAARPVGTTLMSADGDALFVTAEASRIQLYVNASAAMVDIDQPVSGNYYDVKEHLAAAVSLVMFLTSMFASVMWRASELGACLIIDDPLLKDRYGFCDFTRLRDLMRQHGFTTSIAFIPWNWRRTSLSGSELFRRESDLFSVSVHGCDHTAREFEATSDLLLDGKAALAQSRMQRHRARTGIQHDPVMVFPQGIFSSRTPSALKRHEFVAAVNTEVHPVDLQSPVTRIRDVWDLAMTRYGSFPIFTRRYPFHGLENFAFDLLLGKPCLIVSHHQFFRDGGAGLIDLLGRLRALRAPLQWRGLGEVIRRAYRWRPGRDGVREVQMYASELVAANSSSAPIRISVRKREESPARIAAVTNRGGESSWRCEGDYVAFEDALAPGEQACFTVTYKPVPAYSAPRSMRVEASVAARRFLSEIRDEYVQKLRQPSTTRPAE